MDAKILIRFILPGIATALAGWVVNYDFLVSLMGEGAAVMRFLLRWVFFAFLAVTAIHAYGFIPEKVSKDTLFLTALFGFWAAFFDHGLLLVPRWIYLCFGACFMTSMLLSLITEPYGLVDQLMVRRGNPAQSNYIWSQDYSTLLDMLDNGDTVIVSLPSRDRVDRILYLTHVVEEGKDEYRAYNGHESVVVWSSDRHDGFVFERCCHQIGLRFLM